MAYYLRFFMLFTGLFFSLSANDCISISIPRPCAEASQVIRFCNTRNVQTDGALKIELLEMLKSYFKTEAFVESGTYLGGTTSNAAKIFREVHTVELSKKLARKAERRFKQQKNVSVYQGDSGNVFKALLPKISGRILFYLDGHYSGGETAQGSSNTPMLQELAAIRDAKKSDSIILIDDIRCFQDSCYSTKTVKSLLAGYPSLRQLARALLEINPRFQICFLGDALLAFPPDPTVTVSPVVAACAIHRFASEFQEIPESDLEKADLIIKNIHGYERDELMIYQKTYAPFEIENGLRSFGTFWLGLMLSGEGKKQEALDLYKKAAHNSKPGWRAHQLKSMSN